MQKHILVVEDDPIGRKMLVDYLTANGFSVTSAANGLDGLTQAARTRPDLVVCDVALPRKNGFEVCFEVKRLPETRDVPVILISAVCRDAHARDYASTDLHAQGYFTKPFMMSELVKQIRTLLMD